MFNPFDGAAFVSGTILFSAVGIITGNSPALALIAALIAAPFITGLFMVAQRTSDERTLGVADG